MSALREIFVSFTSTFDSRGIRQGNQQTQSLTQQFGALRAGVAAFGPVLAGLAVVSVIRSWGEAVAEFTGEMRTLGDELGDTSARLGIATDDLQAMRLAARLNGVEVGELDSAFTALQRSLANTEEGSEQAEAFKELGVSVTDATGAMLPMGQVLDNLVGPLSAIQNPTERNSRLITLFGRQGARLGPLFAQGAEGMAEARRQMEELGNGASPEMIASAGELDNAMIRLEVATLSLKSAIAETLLPIVTRGVELFTELTAWMDRNRNAVLVLKIVLGAITVVMGLLALAIGAIVAAAVVMISAFGLTVALIGGVLLGTLYTLLETLDRLEDQFLGGRSAIDLFTQSLQSLANMTLDAAIASWEGFTTSMQVAFDTFMTGYRAVANVLGLSSPQAAGQRAGAVQGAAQSVRAGASAPSTPTAGIVAAGRGAVTSLVQNIPINISGVTDPVAVGREVRRHMDRANREASEAHGQ